MHEGYDFPLTIHEEIDSWQLSTRYISTPDRATTSARNTYEGEFRRFEFLTPKMQVDHTMLDDDFVRAKIFHVIGTPERCFGLCEGLMDRRAAIGCLERPIIVWEPMEDSCLPNHLPEFRRVLNLVDIFSPNEDEFAKLLGIDLGTRNHIATEELQHHCSLLLEGSKLKALVVRLGAKGVSVFHKAVSTLHHIQLPAYYQNDQETSKVIEVTGAGNAFIGGYCMSLIENPQTNDSEVHKRAAIWGSVAASFVIEQVGMPSLTVSDHQELWNGDSAMRRVQVYTELITRSL